MHRSDLSAQTPEIALALTPFPRTNILYWETIEIEVMIVDTGAMFRRKMSKGKHLRFIGRGTLLIRESGGSELEEQSGSYHAIIPMAIDDSS